MEGVEFITAFEDISGWKMLLSFEAFLILNLFGAFGDQQWKQLTDKLAKFAS
jgi:hypothetical protein